MSRRGNCYDNSVTEAFSSKLKGEVGERFPSHTDAKAELFDDIEVFYNQRRRHSAARRMSPAAFERCTTQAAQLNRPRIPDHSQRSRNETIDPNRHKRNEILAKAHGHYNPQHRTEARECREGHRQ